MHNFRDNTPLEHKVRNKPILLRTGLMVFVIILLMALSVCASLLLRNVDLGLLLGMIDFALFGAAIVARILNGPGEARTYDRED